MTLLGAPSAGGASGTAKWAFWLGLAGLLISTFNLASYAYQNWWQVPRETRITLAVEISKNYLRDISKETIDLFLAASRDVELTPEQLRSVALFDDTMEYIAFLANSGRLDADFLAPSLVCALDQNAQAAIKHQFHIPSYSGAKGLEIVRFADSHKCGVSTAEAVILAK
jgi:hypothetical protein